MTTATKTTANDIFAALTIAAKELDRDALEPGRYEVDEVVRIVGSFTVGESTDSRTAADHRSVLAYVWERILDDTAKARVKRAIREGAYKGAASATHGELKSVLAPTQKPYTRHGAIKGVATVADTKPNREYPQHPRQGDPVYLSDHEGDIEATIIDEGDNLTWETGVVLQDSDSGRIFGVQGYQWRITRNECGNWELTR